MERQIRLADRRGLLQGRGVSPVQVMALEILMQLEEKTRVEDFMDRLKVALVGHDPEHFAESLFPDIFAPEKVDALEGEWDFSKSQTSPKDAEEILRELTNKPMVLSGEDWQ